MKETICKCTGCGMEKPRIWHGDYLGKGTNKKWVDNTGAAWLGRKCVSCKDSVYAEYRKVNYVPKVKNQVRGIDAKVKTSRKCRHCGDFLPVTRYFNCEICVLPETSNYLDLY